MGDGDDVKLVRDRARQNLAAVLNTYGRGQDKIRDICRLIERGIWNHTIKRCIERSVSLNWQTQAFRAVYKNRYLAVYMNIKRSRSGLAMRILDGEVAPKYTGETMTPDEMDPHKAETDELYRETLIRSNVIPSALDVGPSLVNCRRCSAEHRDAYKVTTYMQQTRSADEPTTVFCHCTVCGVRWRTT
jgi:hypothetical protein